MLPGFLLLRALLLVQSDHLDEARADVRRFLDVDPTYTQTRHPRRHFYFDPERLEPAIRALAIAGLPEN